MRERCSLSTRENARFAAEVLARRGHRARPGDLRLAPGARGRALLARPAWRSSRSARHRRARALDVARLAMGRRARADACVMASREARRGCSRVSRRSVPSSRARGPPIRGAVALARPSVRAPTALTGSSSAAIARAEDHRAGRGPAARRRPAARAQRDPDRPVRRAAARALARILDPDDGRSPARARGRRRRDGGLGGLRPRRVVQGHEETHVRALAARAASRSVRRPPRSPRSTRVATLVRAIGRCGGEQAEHTLRAWLARGRPVRRRPRPTRWGTSRRARGSRSSRAARCSTRPLASPPVGAALYAVRPRRRRSPPRRSRPAWSPRRGRRSARPGPERIFAVRALGRAGDAARSRGPGARARLRRLHAGRARRGGARSGAAAQGRAGGPRRRPRRPGGRRGGPGAGARGDRFAVALAALDVRSGTKPRRGSRPRCGAWRGSSPRRRRGPAGRAPRVGAAVRRRGEARARAPGTPTSFAGCDLGDGEAGERARLASLDRGAAGPRAARRLAGAHAQRARARSRGRARRHRAAPGARRRGARRRSRRRCRADAPGRRGDRGEPRPGAPGARLRARRERAPRRARSGAPPPPSTTPARALDPAVAAALRAALARPWSEDLVETRVALLDAAVAAGLAEARCRARRPRAATPTPPCARGPRRRWPRRGDDAGPHAPPPAASPDPAPELGHALDRRRARRLRDRRRAARRPLRAGARARRGHALRRAGPVGLLHGRHRPPRRPGLRRAARRPRRRRLRRRRGPPALRDLARSPSTRSTSAWRSRGATPARASSS